MSELLTIATSDMSDAEMRKALKEVFDNATIYITFALVCKQFGLNAADLMFKISDDVLEGSGITEAMRHNEITEMQVDRFNENFNAVVEHIINIIKNIK